MESARILFQALSACASRKVWAVDSAGNLFVADTENDRVLVFNNPLVNQNFAATRVLGQGAGGTDFSAIACDNGGSAPTPSATGMCLPIGLALDTLNNLYVADSSNSRVLVFLSPLNNSVANLVIGQGALGNDFIDSECADGQPGDPPVTGSGLCRANGVAVDGNRRAGVGAQEAGVRQTGERDAEQSADGDADQ